jgi:RNA polymerase sigma factor (sigma-70 family)
MDDQELLRAYARGQSQESFRELVVRHLPMVYSAAHRMVRDAHLAEDVAQRVFTTLAQKAGKLAASTVLGGWLYNTTRNVAMHTVRTEQRRREREQAALAMQTPEPGDDMSRILEQLEPAMAELDEAERSALVLRFLEDRSLQEVGQELGITEDAARMRVNRALERLRGVFVHRGITVTSVLLATALAASTTTAVPSGLAATIAAAAVASAVGTTVTTQALVTTMFNAKAFAAIVGAALLAGAGTYVVQQRQLGRLRTENQQLVAQQSQLAAEQEAASKAARDTEENLARLQQDNSELLRLRNEVGQLRRERDAARQRASQSSAVPASGGRASLGSGRFIAKDQLAFAGYGTPEAALESMTWAMMSGNYEQTVASLGPEEQATESQDAKGREQFEAARKDMVPRFQGIQILARKKLSEELVELKVRMDENTGQDTGGAATSLTIQPMIKVGNEWRLGGSTRAYQGVWEREGQIQQLGK